MSGLGARGMAIGAVCAAAMLWGGPARADRDQRYTTPPVAPAATAPVVVQPAVTGMTEAIDRLEQSRRLAALPVDWAGLKAFYNEGAPALWTSDAGYSTLGIQFSRQVQRAAAAGMMVPAEAQSALAALPAQPLPGQAADAEALLSALYSVTAYDVTSPVGTAPANGVALLEALRTAKDPSREVALQYPSFHMFWRMHAIVPAYLAYYHSGGWPTVSGTDKIEPGDKGPRVREVAERLVVTGELSAIGADPELYDPALELAMKAFQKSHGLNDDGVIGKRTIEEMNVTAEARLKMLLLNLERMRSESPSMEDRYVFVNIPSTELRVIDGGVTTFHSNAIVGRVARKTPLLKSEIFQAKLNPDWSVPGKIAAIDMLKHELEEPGYFANKNVRVYTKDGKLVDPRTVNWKEVKKQGYFPYRLKQDAGPENALGPMKLDFQNDHAVFIHGTSAPKLFAKQDRFFSSGCVRVDDPLGLATFLLQDDPAWNRERVEDVVKGGKTTYAKLARPIPLHIVYMTAWVDEQGVANFRKDVYKRDSAVAIPAAFGAPTLVAQESGAAAAPSGPITRQGNNK